MKRGETPARAGRGPYAGPRSPARVMQVLEALAEAGEGLSLAAMATRLGIPKTSLLNHLRVLAATGHVALDDARYVLGPAAIRLGALIASGSAARVAIHAAARRLAADSGETSLVAMLDEPAGEAVYLAVVEGRQPIRYSPAPGTRRPLYCTAMGRALLAVQDDAWIARYLGTARLAPLTVRTVTERRALRQLLGKVAAERVAVTVAEHTDGVGAVAAPVFERAGTPRYAIGVAVPAARLVPGLKRLSALVRDAAREASWALGAPAKPE